MVVCSQQHNARGGNPTEETNMKTYYYNRFNDVLEVCEAGDVPAAVLRADGSGEQSDDWSGPYPLPTLAQAEADLLALDAQPYNSDVAERMRELRALRRRAMDLDYETERLRDRARQLYDRAVKACEYDAEKLPRDGGPAWGSPDYEALPEPVRDWLELSMERTAPNGWVVVENVSGQCTGDLAIIGLGWSRYAAEMDADSVTDGREWRTAEWEPGVPRYATVEVPLELYFRVEDEGSENNLALAVLNAGGLL